MINREKLEQAITAMEKTEDFTDFSITCQKKIIRINVYPKEWWSGNVLSESQRHELLGLLTPLTGKLIKRSSDGVISYSGEGEGCTIDINKADACKVIGYKKVIKRIAKTEMRMVEKEVDTGEYTEEEVEVPVTDCDVRSGSASADDVEVSV